MLIKKNKSLKELTTFKIGGKAKYFACCKTFEELKQAYLFAVKNKIKIFVLGKGSNILFDDKGFSGLVIYNDINFLKFHKNRVYVGAGCSFAFLAVQSVKRNLSGLEFAAGVPGSVGGAIYMNASAFGQAVSDCLQSIAILDEKANIAVMQKDQLSFKYRFSLFQKSFGIVLSAKFLLSYDMQAKKKQKELLEKKLQTQPLNQNNAGCIFRNPENTSAKILIKDCGLEGYRIGGAVVSTWHANFIINDNNASSQDVLKLIAHVKKVVKEKTNIDLIEEVKIIAP